MVRISFISCVLLIGLRLVIGWHFFFEGLYKVNSSNVGPAEISKPFSSAGYFAEAEGPLGPIIREQVGDPDATAVAKLTLVDSGDDKPLTKMPAALAKEWDGYAKHLVDFYKLSAEQQGEVTKKVDQAKNDYVLWLTDEAPKKKDDKEKKKADEPKKIKKTISSVNSTVEYEVDDKVQERVLAYKRKLADIRDFYEHRLPSLGNVEKINPKVRALKTEAATMRSDLMKDVDEQTKKLKDALAKLIGRKLDVVDFGVPEDPAIDEHTLALLTLTGNGNEATVSRMPRALDQQWDAYLAYLRNDLKKDVQRGDEILNDAKLRFVRYLLDQDQYTGTPLPEKEVAERLDTYRKAVTKAHEAEEKLKKDTTNKENEVALAKAQQEPVKYRQAFIDDIKRHTDILKHNLGGFESSTSKGFDNYKGTVEPEKEKVRLLWHDWPTSKLEWLDWSTRWVLLVAGGCLIVGLFTRFACLTCIVFLAIEFLSNPPFPWLPISPKAEGNYTFVNKNIVELMALLVLMSLPTGRWVGLDGIVSRLCPFGSRKNRK